MHAWATVDFGITDGRPTVRQRCTCGSERQVRAFDRTWDPPESELQDDDGTRPAGGGSDGHAADG